MIGLRSRAETRAETEKRAADFFQRRRFWEWTDADQAELDAWLAEAVSHRIAYLRVQNGDARMESLVAHSPPRLTLLQARAPRRHLTFPLLAAASIVLVAALGVLYLRAPIEPPVRTFATNVGGRAALKFGDGTEIELNTDTAVRYRMTTDRRIVWLDRGEAYFRVTHDAANPFSVIVAGHRITDLGTEFLVRDDRGTVNVALVKGRAQLRSETPGAGEAVLMPGDDAVATSVSLSVTKKNPRDIGDELAWRSGMLVFRNTKLADVAREFNRYNESKIVITDPSIAGLKFSAELKTDDYQGFLQLVQAALHLRVDQQGHEFLISRGPETKRALRIRRSSSEAVAQ